MGSEGIAQVVKRINPIAWALLILTHGVFLLGIRWLTSFLQFVLLVGILFSLIWLLMRYNKPLARWRAVAKLWLIYCLLRLAVVGLYRYGGAFLQDIGSAFLMLLAVEAMLAGWFAFLALSIRRDVSLIYIVIFFVVGAPILRFLVIRAGGVLNFLIGQNNYSPFTYFSLVEPSLMMLSCMATLGFITFLPHLLWQIIKDLRRYKS